MSALQPLKPSLHAKVVRIRIRGRVRVRALQHTWAKFAGRLAAGAQGLHNWCATVGWPCIWRYSLQAGWQYVHKLLAPAKQVPFVFHIKKINVPGGYYFELMCKNIG